MLLGSLEGLRGPIDNAPGVRKRTVICDSGRPGSGVWVWEPAAISVLRATCGICGGLIFWQATCTLIGAEEQLTEACPWLILNGFAM
jgi:hypothetical protein